MSMHFRNGARVNLASPVGIINDPVPEFGGLYIGDTTLHNPTAARGNSPGWMGFLTITTTVLDAATVGNISGLATVSIPAGVLIRGMFSQIKLTSGSIIAYNATEQ